MNKTLINKKNSLKILLSNWNNFTSDQRSSFFSNLDSLNQEVLWMNIVKFILNFNKEMQA
jgi:hypothetical protein